MKKIIFIILFLPLIHFGQEFEQEFNKLIKEKDRDKLKINLLLDEWQKKSPNDIEYYIAAFNFYYIESKQEILSLTSVKPNNDEEAFVLNDSLNNEVGYLYGRESKNDSLFHLSQKTIDKGIALFPNRLDLRFGKTHTLGDYEDYDAFTESILNTIDYGKKINHEWLWSKNKKMEEPINFFIDAIQRYQNTLYQAASDTNFKKVAKKMYDTFPEDIYTISSYGITFLIDNKNKEALELYLKAEKINPEDTIVLNNIGLIYERLQDKKKAIQYYSKMYDAGDEETKLMATEKINKLKE